jgi:spore maturation protein CgeB
MNPSSNGMVLVGNGGPEHVGNHLRNAAASLGVPLQFCDADAAYRARRILEKWNWWFRSRRPTHLREFSHRVWRTCADTNPACLLTTGVAPLDSEALEAAGTAGITRMNFLTDDPWNPNHAAKWFMRALPLYDVVFTPRRANIEDLRRLGCPSVEYLPFAYDSSMHFPDPPATADEARRYAADVFFAGGADAERVHWIAALIRAGVDVALYGGYWGRNAETRSHARGHAPLEVIRKAAGGARISLCLVRRANRDGHAMRTYELAAMGACLLAEETAEHREILGAEGVAALYFRTIPEMIDKTRLLLRDEPLRNRLAAAARTRIAGAPNTYSDRLCAMLEHAGVAASAAL